ncbi:restriction endonuclease, partial [bacterium]|nr:restriction endonuclease [bacterium]
KDSVSNKAIQEVVAAKKHYNCQKTLVIATSSFTNSAIVLAKSNDVELWDRETLKRIVEKVNSRTLQEEI